LFPFAAGALCVAAALPSISAAAAAGPAVEVVSSVNPSVYGQKVVLTATVIDPSTPASQIAGTMLFTDEEAILGTAVVKNAKALLSNKALDAGNDPITATFVPSGGGSPVVSAPFPQVVKRADTTIKLVSSRPTAEYGKSGSITASVEPLAPATSTPTGSVDFLIESGWFWTEALETRGKAVLPLSAIYPSFYPGTIQVTAAYSGDENYSPSTSAAPLSQTLVGLTEAPVSTMTLNEKGTPVFSPSSFKLSSAGPVGCNVTITNNTPNGYALLYGTPGSWKRLPGGGIAAGASRGVGVGLEHFTGYFTVIGAKNYIRIKCI
jgi:hypothetical protein